MRNDDRRRRRPCRVDSIEYAILKEKARGYRCRPHAHPKGEMIYVDYGRVLIHSGSTALRLGTGDCFIVRPGGRHGFTGQKGAPFDILNIVFEGKVSQDLTGRVIHLTADERRGLALLKEEGTDRRAFHEQIMVHYLNTFFLLLSRRTLDAREPLLGENRLRYRSRIVNDAIEYLVAHLARALDAEEVARHVGVSASHLRFLLRKETGRSLRQHLRQMRIEAARRLLRESPDNVDAIARRVGYTSVPHFCTIFKRITKVTPGEYARSMR